MAHRIAFVNENGRKVPSFAFTGEPAWHNLGQKVPADLTPAQMAQAARARYRVLKVPLCSPVDFNSTEFDEEGTFHPNTYRGKWEFNGAANVIRADNGTILSVIPKNQHRWKIWQNKDAFEFFDKYVKAGHMSMETAGVIDDGAIVWALAKIKRSFKAIKNDVVEGYFLLTVSHKWGMGHVARFTPVRVVCWNTMSFALSQSAEVGDKVSFNHRKEFDATVIEENLGMANHHMDEYEEKAQFLASKKFNIADVKSYFNEVFPPNPSKAKEKVWKGTGVASKKPQLETQLAAEAAFANLETQPGAKFAPGTWWQAFNAATFYVNHISGKNENNRVRSLWLGEGAKTNEFALNRAVELANAS